jgi:hypothetical protein
MGGLGSGSHGGRSTTEGCRSLDINQLHRADCLRPGWSGGWYWSRGGERVARIDMHAIEGRLILSYRCRYDQEEWQTVEEPVSIVWTSCHFGGSRPWFVCPGVVSGVPCGRRIGKIYGQGRYFLCRHCYRLAYPSQREQPHERARRRANNIRMRLGGDPGMLSPLPEKPKGMHWRTYERLQQRRRGAEMMADEHLWAVLGRAQSRLGKRRNTAPRRAARRQRSKGFWT